MGKIYAISIELCMNGGLFACTNGYYTSSILTPVYTSYTSGNLLDRRYVFNSGFEDFIEAAIFSFKPKVF